MKDIILGLLILFALVSCGRKDNDKNILTVSIDPQKYFLESIVGDKYQVNTLIPSGANPEAYDPTPAQMISLGKSQAYFKVGYFGFENVWVKNVKENVPEMHIIDCSVGINPLECSGHDHNDDHHHAHGHEGSDPHIWSSPATAKIMIKNMYDAVMNIDTENKEYYTSNYNKLVNEIDSVDTVIRMYLEKSENRSFIIYHPALSYFSEEYGLLQYSIEKDGKSPSPSQLKQLIDLAKAENVKTVFIQAEFDQRNAETIAKEIGANIVSINLLSYNWGDEMIKIAKSISSISE